MRKTREHVVRSLDFMSTHAQGTYVCLKEFTNSLTDRAHLVSQFVKGMVHEW